MLTKATLAGLALLGLTATSCSSSCPFGILERRAFGRAVECCGAFDAQDLDLAADYEVDIAHALIPGQSARLDAWLTTPDCTQLFEGAYPPTGSSAAAARCPVYLGPVEPGAVSSRTKLKKGRYRLWVQAWSSNVSRGEYIIDVGIWGDNCGSVVY